MKFDYIKIDGESTADKYGFFKLFFDANENQLLHYYEPELGLFAVESPMVIERALMGGYQPVAFVMIDSLADEMCARFAKLADDKCAYFSKLAEEHYEASNKKCSEESSIDIQNMMNEFAILGNLFNPNIGESIEAVEAENIVPIDKIPYTIY